VISGGLPGDFIVYRHRAFRKTLVGFAHPGGTNIWSGSWTIYGPVDCCDVKIEKNSNGAPTENVTVPATRQ